MFPIRKIELDIAGLVQQIREGQLFSYARYGDGEFKSILGQVGNNANEHDWIPELRQDLTLALLSRPTYRLATVQRFIGETHHNGIRLDAYLEMWDWLREQGLDFEWYDQEIFADSLIEATKRGEVAPWLKFLRDPGPEVGSIVVVGPEYLGGLRGLFDFDFRIPTEEFNCYRSVDEIMQNILLTFVTHRAPVLCMLSLSMVSEVVIDCLHDSIKNRGWLIDVGSIWNPYLGRSNRSYWDKMGSAITQEVL